MSSIFQLLLIRIEHGSLVSEIPIALHLFGDKIMFGLEKASFDISSTVVSLINSDAINKTETPLSLSEITTFPPLLSSDIALSILIVKQQNITDQNKLIQVNKELNFLKETLNKHVTQDEIESYMNDLIDINSKLWVIEDDIRDCEKNKQFDEKFIELARNVYFTNDKRANLKLEINKNFGSELVEVKSYEKY